MKKQRKKLNDRIKYYNLSHLFRNSSDKVMDVMKKKNGIESLKCTEKEKNIFQKYFEDIFVSKLKIESNEKWKQKFDII